MAGKYGELIPLGGGDPIPLMKKSLLVGRRESCDVCLRFSNVSAHHCKLTLKSGYWYVSDLGSRNGTKVDGVRVDEKLVEPNDVISFAKHKYEIQYSPYDLGAKGPAPPDASLSGILGQNLLEAAGLQGRKPRPTGPSTRRYAISEDDVDTSMKKKTAEHTTLEQPPEGESQPDGT
ncbi:MAG: FHA domain-containing protein [Pirellulales bacterium]|nr:FHA domain-containing protein [Pirellulales bacterium]